MLTRMRVKGFKSLEDAEVRFGPLTCIAGLNGVGKSNLFDAIMFLKDLADVPILDAARNIRNGGGQRVDIGTLFTRTSSGQAEAMVFEADILVSENVTDDFKRSAKGTVTFLEYRLELKYVPQSASVPERIELASESLNAISRVEATQRLGFPVSKAFLDSVYTGTRNGSFIDTIPGEPRVVKLRRDQSSGMPTSIPIDRAERTVLSNMNSIEHPTALAARREMQSWTRLQLEPSALRRPDDFMAPTRVSAAGGHMPGALVRIGKFDEVSGRLAHLLPEVKRLVVDIDERRQSKTLYLETVGGVMHEARALSDGTLRFLALCIIGADPQTGGVICLEEPENGIHPARIPAIVELLRGMSVDPQFAVDADNPLRQIVINTHSPLVVQHLVTDDIVVAQVYRRHGGNLTLFSPIIDTWRSGTQPAQARPVAFGALMDYLQNEVDVPAHDGRETVAQVFRNASAVDCQ